MSAGPHDPRQRSPVRDGFDIDAKHLVARLWLVQDVSRSADGTGDVGVDVGVGALRVRLERRCIIVDGSPITLSPRERDVLEVLVRRPGTVVNKQQLLAQVWKGEADGHAVEVTIGRLRRRLAGALTIETLPRRGYRLVAPTG